MEKQLQSNGKTGIIRTVSSLLSEHFYVPKYQRGYRWTEQQVADLMDDIADFEINREKQPTAWYCLQPLVVRRNGDKWNLVDGQQRLTTIRLILRFLNTRFPDKQVSLYTLDYETRGKQDWDTFIGNEQNSLENIDFFHIDHAYQTIEAWIKSRENTGFKVTTFRENLLERCKFIWYDIDQNKNATASEADVFIRLNIGKIPLTNAELIKALFLNSSNFTTGSQKEIKLRQLEIATQWDAMEEELADDAFWYFINGKENNTHPRINYLFEVISGINASENDTYATFRYFLNQFKKPAEDKLYVDGTLEKPAEDNLIVDREWESIYKSYQVLRTWFKDHFYYHYTGYLLTCGESIKNLLDEYSHQTKLCFRKTISNKIKKTIDWDGDEYIKYNDPKRSSRRILLLHNVVTMQRLENDSSRFPFDQYHTGHWDIEHIQAVADPEKKPSKPGDRKKYLDDVEIFVTNDALKNEIIAFTQDKDNLNNGDAFNTLYSKVIQYFSESDIESAKTNTLSNLALLDASTNRGYGNAVFPVKRETILLKDAEGQFIPVCTKNAFLKSYTRKDAGDLNRLYQKDREAYLNDIKEKLDEYLLKGEIK
jgi:hypothetical protein